MEKYQKQATRPDRTVGAHGPLTIANRPVALFLGEPNSSPSIIDYSTYRDLCQTLRSSSARETRQPVQSRREIMKSLAGTGLGQERLDLTATAPEGRPTDPGLHAPAESLSDLLAASLLLSVALIYYVSCASIGWRHAISDAHGFRQSQTAISVHALLQGGPWLIYETPVFGPPWTIPFEFPLYQWIVAALAWTTGMSLEPAGRTVSVIFFLLTLWPTERILSGLRFSLPCRLVILALLLCSPFYIFWSRTFMIESTALFLATMALACTLWAVRNPSAGRLAVTAVICSLAAVVKVTTYFPFLVASVAVVGHQLLRRTGPVVGTGWVRRSSLVIACACLPVLSLVTWVGACDHAKNRSILGARNTSQVLREWNFGTLNQRLSVRTWFVFANRMEQPLGGLGSIGVAALGLMVARRRYAEFLGCLLLYILSLLTFTNLFYVHDYYFFENNIFLVVAVGTAIAAMCERGGLLRSGAIIGLVLLLASLAFDYDRTYRPIQVRNASRLQRLGAAIRERTAPDEILILLGLDWSSEIPYYSERRALCLPIWADPAQIGECLNSLAPYQIGAVVILAPVQKPIPRETLLRLLHERGFEPDPSPVDPPIELLLRANRPAIAARAVRG